MDAAARLPAVDRVLGTAAAAEAIARHGRQPTLAAVRERLAALRAERRRRRP